VYDSGKVWGMSQSIRKLNRLISEYRIKVEHAICEVKCYKVMGTRWRHPRPKLKNLVKICAGFVNRRKREPYMEI
jgi:hypothetical protein